MHLSQRKMEWKNERSGKSDSEADENEDLLYLHRSHFRCFLERSWYFYSLQSQAFLLVRSSQKQRPILLSAHSFDISK